MACLKKRRDRWVLDFYDQHGKRRWKTMPVGTTKKKARATRAERATVFEGDIWADALGVVDKPDATQVEVKRLSDLGVLRYSAPPSRSIDTGRDVTVSLTDDQYSRYAGDTSALIKMRVDNLVERPEWNTWSDKRKVYVIRKAINRGRKKVRDNLKRSLRLKK